MAVSVFELAHVIVGGETTQLRLLFRIPVPMWLQSVGAVNASNYSSMGLALLPDEESLSIRWLDTGIAPYANVPLIYSKPLYVEPGDILAAYFWSGIGQDRVRFWGVR